MPDGTSVMLFMGASLALIMTPGPDMVYVLARGVGQGRRVALASAAGVSVGPLVHTALAAAGLSALLARSEAAFLTVKWAGAAYLVYLGVRTLLDGRGFAPPQSGEAPAAKAGLPSVFFQSVAQNAVNPKVALFFLAFLPQFVSPERGGAALQILALGATFVVLSLPVFGAVAWFSGGLGERLANRPGLAGALRWLTGGVLVGMGLRLAFLGQR